MLEMRRYLDLAVCGNMSRGVTESMVNFSATLSNQRASVVDLHET